MKVPDQRIDRSLAGRAADNGLERPELRFDARPRGLAVRPRESGAGTTLRFARREIDADEGEAFPFIRVQNNAVFRGAGRAVGRLRRSLVAFGFARQGRLARDRLEQLLDWRRRLRGSR